MRSLSGPQKSLARLRTDLKTSNVTEAMDGGLHEYLDGLQNRMNQVDLDVYQGFFAPKLNTNLRMDYGNLGQHQS
jgi:uncharacterized alpha-E superfamily protein